MIRKNKTSLDDIKSSTIETIKKIMSDLAAQKADLDHREKALKDFEKDLAEREKSIEGEVESFGKDVLSIISSKEINIFSKAKRVTRKITK